MTFIACLIGGFFPSDSRAEAVGIISGDDVVSQLSEKASWSKKAAEGFWRVNHRRLEATQLVAPELLEAELNLLRKLNPEGKLLRLLEDYPETSGLVLLAFDRDRLAAAIVDAPEADQGMLVASYLYCTTATDVDEWSAAVQRHPSLIAVFQRRCAALPYHGIFAYLSTMRLPEARKLYGEWLDEVLAPPVIAQDDGAMSSRLDFVVSTGVALRVRLEGDSDFRKEFASKIWPHFRDCINDISHRQANKADIFYLCGGEPLVWDFFRRDDAVSLFQNAGMDCVTLFCGDKPLHPDVQKVAATLLTKGILDLPRKIQDYQDDVNFRELVRRFGENDWPILYGICLQLDKEDANWPKEAAYLVGLSGDALHKEIHSVEPGIIPGAALFSMASKFIDGRRIEAADWAFAAIDVTDLLTLGLDLEVTGPAKIMSKETIQQSLKTGAKESFEKLTGRTEKDLGREGAEGEWTQCLVKRALEVMPNDLRHAIVKGGIVDITAPVKSAFEISRKLGLGREPFKKLTAMEARVFMRQDGRVFINFTHLAVKPSPVARFLTRTLENGVVQSETVAQGVRSAMPELQQWREDVSAWWSGHATGQF